MKNLKRFAAMLMLLAIVFTMVPVQAFATQDGTQSSMDMGDVSVQGTNGFGTLLSQEIDQSQAEADAEAEEYEPGYSVTDLVIEDRTAFVTYASMEDAMLVVALYTEDGMQLLTSATTQVTAEDTEAVLEFGDDMPEYFEASAYLLDTYDCSPLCAFYDTPMYTRDMQELLESTVDDYDPELVLNLDDDKTTNFAVYQEDTIVIEETPGINIVTSVDDENSIYIIENADEQITGLKTGDVCIYFYGEDQLLIFKTASIEIDGTTATISGDSLEIEEVFSHMKIDGQSDTADMTVDDSTAGEGISYVGLVEEPNGDIQTFAWEGVGSVTAAHEFAVNIQAEEKLNGITASVTVKGSLKLELPVTLKYYISWSRQYLEFKAVPKITLSASISGSLTLAEKLGYIGVSPVPGVYIGFEPELQLKFTSEISVNATLSATIGFTFESGKFHNISQPPKLDVRIKAEGTIFFGVDFKPNIKIIHDKIGKASLSAMVGEEFKGTATGQMYELQGKDKRHECQECLKIDITFKAELSGSLVFLNWDKLTFKVDIGKFSIPIGEMYWSLDRDDFGLGTCPHCSYRTTLQVTGRTGEPIPSAQVNIEGYKSITMNEHGLQEVFMPAGNYQLSASHNGMYCLISADVPRHSKIILSLIQDEDGDGRDDETGEPSKNDTEIDFGGVLDYGEIGECIDSTIGFDAEFDGGDGSIENPYQVSNANQLNAVRNDMEAHYIQTADIDLSGLQWDPIGHRPSWDDYGIESFQGTFDGNGYTISNMTITSISSENESIGFFGVNDGTLMNITLVGLSIDVNVHIECCSATIGGIAGTSNGTISNCTVDGSIHSECNIHIRNEEDYQGWNPYQYVGGIVGEGECSNCTNYANISASGQYEIEYMSTGESCEVYCGGIVGHPGSVNGEIKYCINYGDVSASADGFALAGGISGNDGSMHYCINYGDVSSNSTSFEVLTYHQQSCAGGIVGVTSADLSSHCINLGNVSANKACKESGCTAGGIVGYLGYYGSGDISDCYNLGQRVHADITDLEDPKDSTLVESTTYVGAIHGDWYYWDGESRANGCYSLNSTTLSNTKVDRVYGYSGVSLNEKEIKNKIKDILQILGLSDVARTGPVVIEQSAPPTFNAVFPGDYGTEETENYTLKTASFKDLVPGQQYILLAMKSIEAENPLASDNLLYIDQAAALDDGTLNFRYVQRETADISYVVACGASNKDLKDAEITFPEMTADGTLQVIDPTVVYDGETLTEGIDYTIVGTVDYTDGGTYTCSIRGIRSYTGLVECTYTVSGADVKPNAPTLKVSNVASSGKVKVTWNKVDGAAKYEVYRATSKSGTYKLQKTTTGTTYTNTTATAGKTYYYYVVAVAENGIKSDPSAIKSRTCDLPRPMVTLSNVASSGKIKISWDAVSGAVEYTVYRATSPEGEFKRLTTTKNSSVTNTSTTAGTTYYYTVVAVAEKSAANSAESQVQSLTCTLAQPTVTLSNVASTGKIKISWAKVDGAVKYEVWRATSKNGSYSRLTTTTATSVTNTKTEAGKTYYYKVKALAQDSEANSAYSTAVSRTCDLAQPVVTIALSTKKPKVSWKKIDGATKYEVYRATSKNGTYSKVKTTTSTSYKDTAAKSGKTYYYKVVAVCSKTAGNSAYSAVKSIKSK